MSEISLTAYRFIVKGYVVDLGAPWPDASFEHVLQDAVRAWYVKAGADQGRWVEVVSHVPLGRVRKHSVYARHMVRTSRGDAMEVKVRLWSDE